MNRINPIWYVVVVLAVAGVVGAIMYARRPGTKAPAAESAQTALRATETKEQLAARREHMEITQKSMARAADAPAQAAAKEAERTAAAPAPAVGVAVPVRNAAKIDATEPAPKAAGPKPVPHKQLDALDKMGEDLAGQLK